MPGGRDPGDHPSRERFPLRLRPGPSSRTPCAGADAAGPPVCGRHHGVLLDTPVSRTHGRPPRRTAGASDARRRGCRSPRAQPEEQRTAELAQQATLHPVAQRLGRLRERLRLRRAWRFGARSRHVRAPRPPPWSDRRWSHLPPRSRTAPPSTVYRRRPGAGQMTMGAVAQVPHTTCADCGLGQPTEQPAASGQRACRADRSLLRRARVEGARPVGWSRACAGAG